MKADSTEDTVDWIYWRFEWVENLGLDGSLGQILGWGVISNKVCMIISSSNLK